MRKLLIEKYIPPTYITPDGIPIWLNEIGDQVLQPYSDGAVFIGKQTMEAGYVYAPYIPLTITPPETFDFVSSPSTRGAIMSRYRIGVDLANYGMTIISGMT